MRRPPCGKSRTNDKSACGIAALASKAAEIAGAIHVWEARLATRLAWGGAVVLKLELDKLKNRNDETSGREQIMIKIMQKGSLGIAVHM